MGGEQDHGQGRVALLHLAQQADAEPAKREAMQAVMAWAQQLNLADEAKLKQALAAICGAARKTAITKVADLQALEFDGVLAKAGILYGGISEALAVYGCDIDAMCKSAKIGAATVTGDKATVPVSIEFFGKRIEAPAKLIRLAGKWYPEVDMEKLAGAMGADAPMPVAP